MSTTPKASIPDALRWLVWERDDFRCQYCGSRQFLSIDHVNAESKGGLLSEGNLITACVDCNRRKAARDVSEYLLDDRSIRYRVFWDAPEYETRIEQLVRAAEDANRAAVLLRDECRDRYGRAPEIPDLVWPGEWNESAA